ncbi:MAG: ATP synthase F1 subunit delta [Spirochaetia bacterium]|nr:ATP synthase F1 subunit delta [Spirochaetia bacterium]
MKEKELAQRYALALAEVSGDKLQDVEKDLESIVSVFQKSKQARLFFESPRISSKNKKELIQKTLKGKVHQFILNLLLILVDRRREIFLTEIFEAFIIENDKNLGRSRAMITLGRDYSDAELKSIIADVEKAIESKSKEFGISEKSGNIEHIISTKVRPDILGGIIIRIGDKIWDSSVRRYLLSWQKNAQTGKKLSINSWES